MVNIAVFAAFSICIDVVFRIQAGLPGARWPIRGKSGKKVARMFAVFADHVATGIARGSEWGGSRHEMEGIAAVNGRRTETEHECSRGARVWRECVRHGHGTASGQPHAVKDEH